ncbi:UNVERIFIED_CONTAM: hypothetical protein Scaly_1164500 [Sesamum calycinum]|uniref:Transposon Ty3-I Gag-Pol polyprotein n=1 Tax=Sesamum calycinum TaxID=2727403 RepID=A0AAW2Q3B6_9LAMI
MLSWPRRLKYINMEDAQASKREWRGEKRKKNKDEGPSRTRMDLSVPSPINFVDFIMTVGTQLKSAGSSADILFGEAYDQMQLGDVPLEAVDTSLYGFAREIKFPVIRGVGEAQTDALQARKCYVEAIKRGKKKRIEESLDTEDSNKQGKDPIPNPEPNKENLTVQPVEQLLTIELTPGRKWRMCIDFWDLNKACPKDFYPSLRIDQLVDSTSGCELLSIMDASQGYQQIMLAPEDHKRVSVIT